MARVLNPVILPKNTQASDLARIIMANAQRTEARKEREEREAVRVAERKENLATAESNRAEDIARRAGEIATARSNQQEAAFAAFTERMAGSSVEVQDAVIDTFRENPESFEASFGRSFEEFDAGLKESPTTEGPITDEEGQIGNLEIPGEPRRVVRAAPTTADAQADASLALTEVQTASVEMGIERNARDVSRARSEFSIKNGDPAKADYLQKNGEVLTPAMRAGLFNGTLDLSEVEIVPNSTLDKRIAEFTPLFDGDSDAAREFIIKMDIMYPAKLKELELLTGEKRLQQMTQAIGLAGLQSVTERLEQRRLRALRSKEGANFSGMTAKQKADFVTAMAKDQLDAKAALWGAIPVSAWVFTEEGATVTIPDLDKKATGGGIHIPGELVVAMLDPYDPSVAEWVGNQEDNPEAINVLPTSVDDYLSLESVRHVIAQWEKTTGDKFTGSFIPNKDGTEGGSFRTRAEVESLILAQRHLYVGKFLRLNEGKLGNARDTLGEPAVDPDTGKSEAELLVESETAKFLGVTPEERAAKEEELRQRKQLDADLLENNE